MKRSEKDKDIIGSLASRLAKRYPDEGRITLRRTTSIVFGLEDLAWLDAFAKHTGESRSAVAAEIIGAGIHQVIEKLDDDSRRRLEALRLAALDRLVKQQGKQLDGELFAEED